MPVIINCTEHASDKTEHRVPIHSILAKIIYHKISLFSITLFNMTHSVNVKRLDKMLAKSYNYTYQCCKEPKNYYNNVNLIRELLFKISSSWLYLSLIPNCKL